MQSKILLVDDNKEIIELLIPHLKKANFDIITANDGQEALNLFNQEHIDLILLDIMMPKVDGITVCKKVRSQSKIPIIMITAKSEDEDVIMGLDVGADDYIVKPFSPKQVVAKIKALLRRLEINNSDDEIVKIDNLEVNMSEYTVKINNENKDLTKKEIEILYLLCKHPSMVYTREKLLDLIWGYDYYGDVRNVDTHIKRMRAKLGLSNHEVYNWDIKTVWGVGYKFEVRYK